MRHKEPSRPTHISQYAEDCLNALSSSNLGKTVSLGGAFGLLHYLDHRPTHDVDAWWLEGANSAQRQQVLSLIVQVLERHGNVRIRQWGDVSSVELLQDDRTVFSFQVAERSVQLEDSVPTQWTDVLLDSLDDLIASKMTALVERGAPRDFIDVHAVCEAGIATASTCWQLWFNRQERAGDSTSSARARMAVTTHLKRIEMRRPLRGIENQKQRLEAQRVRTWFRGEFLDAGLD